MGKLQTVRDVFTIIRDFLVILFFIVLVITLLAIYNFISNFNPSMLSSMIGSGMPNMQGMNLPLTRAELNRSSFTKRMTK